MDEHQPIAIVFIFIFTITRINYSSLHLGHLVEEPRVALTGARRLLRLARRLRRLGVTLFLLHTLDAIHCQKNVSLCRVVRVGRLWASIGFLRLLQFDIQPLGFVVVAQIHFDHPLRHLALPDFEFLHTRRRIGRLALLRRYLRAPSRFSAWPDKGAAAAAPQSAADCSPRGAAATCNSESATSVVMFAIQQIEDFKDTKEVFT
eukprot:Selendium_serpulae@DN5243_c0_g1_i7.p1